MNEIFNIHQERIKYEESTDTCYNIDEPQKHQMRKASHKTPHTVVIPLLWKFRIGKSIETGRLVDAC